MHDKIVLLAKAKLNNIKVLISTAVIDSNITHDQLVTSLFQVKKNYRK